MKNNNAKVSKPKKPAKSKVYTQKKPCAKLQLKKVEADTNSINNVNYIPPVYTGDTNTTQANYISVSVDEHNKTYTTSDANSLYAKVDDPVETDTKRSEILPEYKESSHTNMIVILIGIAAFAALLLLLI
jgi:hypothetical protein